MLIHQLNVVGHPLYEAIARDVDVSFYRLEYVDLRPLSDKSLVEHYFGIGWIEGRNPNPWFDTVKYLADYPEVASERICPFFHFLGWGKKEGRKSRYPLSIRTLNSRLFHDSEINWVDLIDETFDADFYRTQMQENWEEPINLAAHYLFSGWRFGLLPREGYERESPGVFGEDLEKSVPGLILDLAAGKAKHYTKDLAKKERRPSIEEVRAPISPFKGPDADIRQQLIQLSYESALVNGNYGSLTVAKIERPRYENEEFNIVAEGFDHDFYANKYPDVANSMVDPLEHYCGTGWRERRDPTPWFSTEYYLTTYSDIASAGVNPFWHYLIAGRHEGRLPRGGGSAKRTLLESLKPLEVRTADYTIPDHQKITVRKLETVLKKVIAKANGFVLAVSHDCYPTVTGGIQIFVADEQIKFNTRGFTYVHLSPLRAALHVKDDVAETTETRIVINGTIVGVASDAEIADALKRLSDSLPERRIFVVHSPLGHSVRGLTQIQSALRPKYNYFWLHDYTLVCAGFQLLRNDVEYCGAPEIQSEACRICIYGATRQVNERRLSVLFEHCNFTLVSPSEATRAIWLKASTLPSKGVLVVEHCRLREAPEPMDVGDPAAVGTEARAVRVAFVGYPIPHKGWLTFERLLDQAADYANYNFYHFASAGSLRTRRNLRGVESSVTADGRDLMIRRLREHEIDLVVIAAEWPETFSYVTFEALAAGADVLTLERSGNVAAAVRKLRRGRVFDHEDEIVEFFTSGKAIAYARARAAIGAYASELIHDGTTAALI